LQKPACINAWKMLVAGPLRPIAAETPVKVVRQAVPELQRKAGLRPDFVSLPAFKPLKINIHTMKQDGTGKLKDKV
jgi:hypothetical protein